MPSEVNVGEIQGQLESFLERFEEYAGEINGERRSDYLNRMRHDLQRLEPLITDFLIDINGEEAFSIARAFERPVTYRNRDLIVNAIAGGNNEEKINFYYFHTPVQAQINKAIGRLEQGLWPPKYRKPILKINDPDLLSRCLDLLNSSGNYDRVIREATTILEDRIRSKCPHEILTKLIPNSNNQRGENLVNKLLSPDNSILSISDEKKERIALHRILLGTISYLRNPYHHAIDPDTEWSWAWSTVGLIDRLLMEIESCRVIMPE